MSQDDDDEAFNWFCSVRWHDTDGKPVCPKCSSMKVYYIPKRRTFKCSNKYCYHQFSPTSGTEWHARKLTYTKIREIMIDMVENHNLSATKLAERHSIDYHSAWFIKKRSQDSQRIEKGKQNGNR